MNSGNINIVVQKQSFLLSRDLLASESDSKDIKLSADYTLPFPDWVTKQSYLLILNYLQTKDVAFLAAYTNDPDLIVKVLRTADYLSMSRFHDRFIGQVLLPSISNRNCLALIEESYKKLKNMSNSQSWYNLLNMAITYLSANIYDIFNEYPNRLKTLNEKLLNEVLQRVIRFERKNNFANKHKLFQLITECKQGPAGGSENLCRYMRANILNKKIHAKIHAKLSWKLERLAEITDKRTKVFKFLNLKWYLCAARQPEGLLITLNIIPYQLESSSPMLDGVRGNFDGVKSQFSSSSSLSSSSQAGSAKSEKSLMVQKEGESKVEDEILFQNDTFSKLGVFYSKVIWKVDKPIERETNPHYILMNEESPISIILFDKQTEANLGDSKVELAIFCNMDQLYTFVLNYIYYHFDALKFRGPHFSIEEMLALIELSKNQRNYSSALRITSELIYAHPNQKFNSQLATGYSIAAMTRPEQDIYANVFGKQVVSENYFIKPKNISTSGAQERKSLSPIAITPINYVYKQPNFRAPSVKSVTKTPNTHDLAHHPPEPRNRLLGDTVKTSKSISNREALDSSLNHSRADSRGSKRKIFNRARNEELSPNKLMEQMLRVTDFRRYLTPQALQSDAIKSAFS